MSAGSDAQCANTLFRLSTTLYKRATEPRAFNVIRSAMSLLAPYAVSGLQALQVLTVTSFAPGGKPSTRFAAPTQLVRMTVWGSSSP